MAAQRLLELAPGVGFRIDGVDWVVDEVEPQHGRVVLVSAEGQTEDRTVSWLMHHRPEPLAEVVEMPGRERRRAQPRTLADLNHETWHVLRWTGLPPQGEVPAFSDKTVEALMADVRLRKLKVLSDSELLPALLQILRSAAPVDQWPTQMTRKEKVSRSRLASQGRAAASDRPPATAPAAGETSPYADAQEPAGPSWPREARTVQAAVDADLRRRREDLEQPPKAPQLLDDALRQRSLFPAA
ncbi:hypothetical protein [Streptomyces lancefieldiae]|uniref:Uncharacterized protein n=1 Tax=Streptomyces lancefieldiae TaxID=3075520 RepID=A0ABU3AKZ7_9ACTN|nr:hypothetical protein [Streptomyces sp. DSM 40712]MDT0610869.1 hypothetical protein [Streptomyces sp. DSM 40712]